MKGTMKALLAYDPYDYRYEDIPIPSLEEGEILLKVKGCGICAGDLKAYHGGIRIWGTSENNRYIDPPVIGGHEFWGEIIEMAGDIKGYKIGDHVTPEQIVPCNECEYCRKGLYWMCKRSAVLGFKKYAQGGFAEYVKLNKNSILHKVPNEFSTEQAVLIEPIACGMHAIEIAQIKHKDVVVIAGLGAIGLSMVSIMRNMMPKMIIGIDMKEHRLELGKEFGANLTFNPSKTDVIEKILNITNGYGCDVYIEASGSTASVTQGLNCIRNKGTYLQMGVFAEEVTADWNIIGDGKELTIKGSHLSALTYTSVINGIKNSLIKTDGLISHTFPLKEWEEAFYTAENDPKATKVMLIA